MTQGQNPNKRMSNTNGPLFMKEAFEHEQNLLKCKLEMSSNTITHSGKAGDINENHFIDSLSKYLPDRYKITSGIVIDSSGATSDQIDVVIYDNQYTPILLSQQNHYYIPAESVYAVFEAKPLINKNYLDYAGAKAGSVRRLKRTSVSIHHAGGVYPAKEHFEILAGILAIEASWVDGLGTAFKSNIKELKGDNHLDFCFAVKSGCYDNINGTEKIVSTNSSFGYFVFRLLNRLQSLGTVPAVDWSAYAECMIPST